MSIEQKIEIDPKRPMREVIVEVQKDFAPGSYVAFVQDPKDQKFYAIAGDLQDLMANYKIITGTILPHTKGANL